MPEKPDTTRPRVSQFSTAEWFAELDRLNELVGEPFLPNGREQPAMPPDREIFD